MMLNLDVLDELLILNLCLACLNIAVSFMKPVTVPNLLPAPTPAAAPWAPQSCPPCVCDRHKRLHGLLGLGADLLIAGWFYVLFKGISSLQFWAVIQHLGPQGTD